MYSSSSYTISSSSTTFPWSSIKTFFLLPYLSTIIFSCSFLDLGAFLIPASSTSLKTFLTFPNSSISSTSLTTFLFGFWPAYLFSSSASFSFILLIASFLIFATFLTLTFPCSSIYSSSSYTISSSSTTFPWSSNKTFFLFPYLSTIIFSCRFLDLGAFLIPSSSTSLKTFLTFPNSSISSTSLTTFLLAGWD